ncbi:MAG: shikimate kinase [Lachnospiraceae bacterium]|nr:shikimate kinase [Lachnospiraceae bacterium]
MPNEKKTNIVLIGMPASGKSTVGVILAKVLGMDFIDSDLVIQKREGARLNELIEKYGVDDFMRREEAAILGINVTNTVIATGGSAVYSAASMAHLAENSCIVYLKVELDVLKKRLSDIKGRGVVLRDGETLETIYETRAKLYEKYADITIEETGASVKNTIEDTVEDTVRGIIG